MKKKSMAISGGHHICEIASGYAINVKPGPANKLFYGSLFVKNPLIFDLVEEEIRIKTPLPLLTTWSMLTPKSTAIKPITEKMAMPAARLVLQFLKLLLFFWRRAFKNGSSISIPVNSYHRN